MLSSNLNLFPVRMHHLLEHGRPAAEEGASPFPRDHRVANGPQRADLLVVVVANVELNAAPVPWGKLWRFFRPDVPKCTR